MPTYGWFSVTIDGKDLSLLYRHKQADHSFDAAYKLSWTDDGGWK